MKFKFIAFLAIGAALVGCGAGAESPLDALAFSAPARATPAAAPASAPGAAVSVNAHDGVVGSFVGTGASTAVYAEVRGTTYGEAVVGISPTDIGVGVRAVGSGTGTALLVQGPLRIDTALQTGATAAPFSGTKPGSYAGTQEWLEFRVGSTVYLMPVWRKD
ncbi:MAG TPA: hypothetical protein VEB22_04310 [Phycisphaerales bacterium]|nr:hypothetical protein [Phycisphaerales bacterium]